MIKRNQATICWNGDDLKLPHDREELVSSLIIVKNVV